MSNDNWEHIIDVEYTDGGKLRLYSNKNGTFVMNSKGELSQNGCKYIKTIKGLLHLFYNRSIKSYKIIQ
jgi:hypothetical protein